MADEPDICPEYSIPPEALLSYRMDCAIQSSLEWVSDVHRGLMADAIDGTPIERRIRLKQAAALAGLITEAGDALMAVKSASSRRSMRDVPGDLSVVKTAVSNVGQGAEDIQSIIRVLAREAEEATGGQLENLVNELAGLMTQLLGHAWASVRLLRFLTGDRTLDFKTPSKGSRKPVDGDGPSLKALMAAVR